MFMQMRMENMEMALTGQTIPAMPVVSKDPAQPAREATGSAEGPREQRAEHILSSFRVLTFS